MQPLVRILAFLLLAIPVAAQIGAKAQASKIYGVWQNSQFGYQMTLILSENGTGEFDGESIQYQTKATILSITQNGTTTPYNFSLQGNSLVLSGGDLEGKVTFTRNGNTGSAPASAPVTGSVTPPLEKSDGLVGAWSGSGETIEFKKDGNCIYLGQPYPYQISQGNVTLSSSQGSVTYAYVIQGNQLTLSGSAGKVVYTRGSANPSTNSSKGSVARELVGRWQWINVNTTSSGGSSSSSYIQLNADGTYEYASESSRSVNTSTYSGGTSSQDSDRGTWWVQGDRIFYSSPTKGQGSYLLQKRNHPKNGDPMIVIDGQTYVTSTVRDPWR